MVKTLNETAIYHIKIRAQHERAPNTFLQNTQYSFKNQRSMHGNELSLSLFPTKERREEGAAKSKFKWDLATRVI